MDDMRIALVIVGLVVVAGVYAYARAARRRAARRAQELERQTLDSHDEHAYDAEDSGSSDPGSTREATGTEADIGRLGGVFAATRETSDVEISVDVSILAGLRATYESTMDGTLDGSVEESVVRDSSYRGDATEPSVESGADRQDVGVTPSTPDADAVTEPLDAIDMTRPLVYLTLVGKQERVSGQVVLDSLGEEGFRPGLMRLYYWRSDAEPSVVFGVANMVEPGVLDPAELPDIETPGLVTFMSVPDDAASAFGILDAMVSVSRRLARRIDATVCDETRSTLTAQAENHLREHIADILRQDRIQD